MNIITRRKLSFKREKSMKLAAHKLGMKYLGKDKDLLDYLLDFELFKKGIHKRKKRINRLMRRVDQYLTNDLYIFDYEYKRGKRRHQQTVFFLKSKELGLPQLLLEPETLMHKIKEYFQVKDIDFESYPKFSDAYHLQGDNEEWVREKIGQHKTIRFFNRYEKWHFEANNYFMILYRDGGFLPSKKINHLHRSGMRLFKLLKEDELI